MHTYTGVPASTGIVVGPVEQIDHGTTGLHRIVCDPFRERALYDVAVVLAKDELRMRIFCCSRSPCWRTSPSRTRSVTISPPVRAGLPPSSAPSRFLRAA